MHPYLHTLWQSIAGVLVPESLAVDKARNRASRRGVFELVAPRAAVLKPGDLIVVRTPGTLYQIFRSAANHKVDHLAIVMENGMFLHVGPPTIRLLPVELLLTPNRRPLVFRPKLTQEELDSLLRSLKSLIGQQYDTVRVYSFVARLAMNSYFGARFPLAAPKMAKAGNDLVYDNSKALPLQSGAWVPKGEGAQLSEEAYRLVEENKRRRGGGGIVRTIGGRNEEFVDEDAVKPPPTATPTTDADGNPVQPSEAVICTDAILPRLLSASAEWRAAVGLPSAASSSSSSSSSSAHPSTSDLTMSQFSFHPLNNLSRGAAALRKKLDFFRLRSWSINDVFHFNAMRPDLLQRVHLPPVKMPEEFKDLSDEEDAQQQQQRSSTSNATTLDGRARMPFFAHPAVETIEAYMQKNHPALAGQAAHLEVVLTHVYETASPLFRSLIQLYSFTMKRLPIQVQAAIRLYIFLLALRQILHLYRGYTLVKHSVTVVKNVLQKPVVGAAVKVATNAVPALASNQRGRSKSPSPTKTSTQSPSQSKSKSRSRSSSPPPATLAAVPPPPRRRGLFRRADRSASASPSKSSSPITKKKLQDALSKPLSNAVSVLQSTALPAAAESLDTLLSNPNFRPVLSILSSQFLPPELMNSIHQQQATIDLLQQFMSEIRASKLFQQQQANAKDGTSSIVQPFTGTEKKDNTKLLANIALPSTTSPKPSKWRSAVTSIADATTATAAASSTLASAVDDNDPQRIRKRDVVKSAAKTSASILFPRTTRLVQFARDEVGRHRKLKSDMVRVEQKATRVAEKVVGAAEITAAAANTAAAALVTPARRRLLSRSRSPSPASGSISPARSSSASRSRSVSPTAPRSLSFAQKHPGLASTVEQLKLVLVSALAVQFADQIRSAL